MRRPQELDAHDFGDDARAHGHDGDVDARDDDHAANVHRLAHDEDLDHFDDQNPFGDEAEAEAPRRSGRGRGEVRAR
jgi:hypothetical protein